MTPHEVEDCNITGHNVEQIIADNIGNTFQFAEENKDLYECFTIRRKYPKELVHFERRKVCELVVRLNSTNIIGQQCIGVISKFSPSISFFQSNNFILFFPE